MSQCASAVGLSPLTHQFSTKRSSEMIPRWLTRLGLAHGAFYVVTGIWPIFHLPSFLFVTGPKTDLWLVQTVGALLAVFGAVLFLAARRIRLTPEWCLLAAGFAAALATIDIVFVSCNVIAPIYLADAAVEIPLFILWLLGWQTLRRGSV